MGNALPAVPQLGLRDIRLVADDIAVFPLSFGAIHGGVGIADKIFRPLVKIRTHRNANAGTDGYRLSNLDRRMDFRKYALRYLACLRGILHVIQEDREFVAAITSDEVPFSHRAL